MKIINREDWSFGEFLRQYWWIEFLVIVKVIYFSSEGLYGLTFGMFFLLGVLVILWILYRLGMN